MLVTLSESKFNNNPNLFNRNHNIDCKFLFIEYPINDMVNDILSKHCVIIDGLITVMIDIENGLIVNWNTFNNNKGISDIKIDINDDIKFFLCDKFTSILSQFNGNENKIDCILPYTDDNSQIKFTVDNATGRIIEFNDDRNTLLLNFKDDLTIKI